jgi:hypothetical protein
MYNTTTSPTTLRSVGLEHQHKPHNTIAQYTTQTQLNNNTSRLDRDINRDAAPLIALLNKQAGCIGLGQQSMPHDTKLSNGKTSRCKRLAQK